VTVVNKATDNMQSIKSITEKVRAGNLDAVEVIEDTRQVISETDGCIRAWQTLDWDEVERQVEVLVSNSNWRSLPLAAVPIAVKDVYDTDNFVTTYGSSIYSSHRPSRDAKLVSILRSLGAIVVGKTVTTEFAYWQPGPTVNPYNKKHTPGGSSSGSAAAVSSGMIPVALGSQTAASVIRPASYCGVYGFKPSYGILPLDGVKPLAPSLDHAGFLARSLEDIKIFFTAILGHEHFSERPLKLHGKTASELAVTTLSGAWEMVLQKDCQKAVEDCFAGAKSRGSKFSEEVIFSDFERLTSDQTTLMAAESVQTFEYERKHEFQKLSDHIKNLLEEGSKVTSTQLAQARIPVENPKEFEDRLFCNADILLCPSTLDTAPLLGTATGNPLMSRAFNILGLPTLTVPYGLADNGLPLGVQVVGRRGNDFSLLLFAEKYLTKRR
jgi:Asp-tRNA(Asn)/Glu-tRNA(Gln) amidotransferase A subunit family amidase